MDRLEEFVKNNRTDFDKFEPSSKVWKAIDSNVKSKKVRKMGYLKYAAAVAIFIIGFSTGSVKDRFFNTDNDKLSKSELESQSQLIESEFYYVSQINSKMSELEPFFASDPKLKQDIQIDFDELDTFYKQLKTDLDDDINNAHVIEAMIQSYEMKLKILETLLKQLKQEDSLNENNEFVL